MRAPLVASASTLLVLVLAPIAAAGSLFVVDAAGGPGSDFTTLADAVQAAADGDTVFVRSGTYAEPVANAGKALAIVGDPAAKPTFTEPSLVSAQSSDTLTVRGLRVQSPGPTLSVVAAVGTVLLEDLLLEPSILVQPPMPSGTALNVVDSPQVIVSRSTLRGTTFLEAGGTMAAIRSGVFLYDADVEGGETGLNRIAVSLFDSSSLFVSGGSIRGGRGQDGLGFVCDGGPGGDAILLHAGTSVTLLDAEVAGGEGGAPVPSSGCESGANGQAFELVDPSATVTFLPGSRINLSTPATVAGATVATLTCEGEPGAAVFVLYAADFGAPLSLRVFDGPLHLDFTTLDGGAVGILDASGHLAQQVPFAPSVAPALGLALQPMALNGSNGRLTMGTPSHVTIASP